MSFSLNAFTRGFAAYIAGTPSITITEFGLNVPVLGDTGGYSSSEAWVVKPDKNPEINTLPSLRHTAGANDRITKLTIAWALTAEDVLEDKSAIALIGIYANDVNKTLISSTEFRSESVEGKYYSSVDVDIPLTEGVEYFICVSPNGWTRWPTFRPNNSGSITYKQTTSGVQEDLGGLTSSTSSRVMPCYATVESK